MNQSDIARPSLAPFAPALRMPVLQSATLLGTMSMVAYMAVIGPIARQISLPEWTVGLSISIGGVFWMLLARWWGSLSDRHGRRRVLLVGFGGLIAAWALLVTGIGLALHHHIGSTSAAVVMVGGRALIGALYAAVPAIVIALIADHTPPMQRTGHMAQIGTANGIGMVAGPGIAGAIASYDLTMALFFGAVLPLVAWFTICYGIKPDPTHTDILANVKPKHQTLKLFDRRLRLVALVAWTAMTTVGTAQTLIGFFAIDRLGLNPHGGARVAGLALTTVGACSIISQQFVIKFKKLTPENWVCLGTALAGLSFLSILAVHNQNELLLCYGVAGFGMGCVFPAMQAMTTNAVQQHEQGAAAGSISSVQGFAIMAAPLVATLLYRILPTLPYVLVAAMLLALSTLLLVLHTKRRAT